MADLIWPFADKQATQQGRTDEGWDLVFPQPGLGVINVAAGTLHMAGPDPGGFGTDYPVLKLDTPITVNGQTFTSIYYGHTHMIVPPGHYAQGITIARTGGGSQPLGGSGAPGEVEIGFGDPNVPKGQPGSISFNYGPLMKQALGGAVSNITGADQSGASLFGDSAGALAGIGSSLGDIAKSLTGFATITAWLTKESSWVRILAGTAGSILVFTGIWTIGKEVRSG